ncbi:hypothetical protein HK101_007344 [Irineochytrium annulatum]|nr:hypothetical protein HK101_007344 [Irineochytrium annulatum]
MTTAFLVLGSLLSLRGALALDNGLGLTPAMGWNSWNLFACNINEDIIKDMADAIVEKGLDKLGYVYVNVDDCWQESRDEDGFIVEDKKGFPHGMKALGEYIHDQGLLFGTYSSAGTYTCQYRPGSLHYETEDAVAYAMQEVDYLKLDNCYNEGMSDREGTIYRYAKMRDALNATGRPMLYSLCNWGEAKSWEYSRDIGNSWRTTGDICDNFDFYTCSAMSILDQQIDIVQYSAPGGFNDIDMLEVGNGGMTMTEYRTHFSAWCALKSPLLLGNDLRELTDDVMEIIGNEEVIAINQDTLGESARLMERKGGVDVWAGPLANGDRVLLVINRGKKAADYDVDLGLIGADREGKNGPSKVKARDLWKKKDIGVFKDEISFKNIASHDSRMLRISSASKKPFKDLVYPSTEKFKRYIYLIPNPSWKWPLIACGVVLGGALVWVGYKVYTAVAPRQGYIFLK